MRERDDSDTTTDIGGVCLVTQPERSQTGKSHAGDLADVIAELTSVVLLTANLPTGAPLRDDHAVVEYSTAGTGERVLVEAFRFLRNQLRLCLAIARRDEEVMLFFGTTAYLLPMLSARLLGKTVVVLPRGDVPLSLRLRWESSMPDALARLLAGIVATLEHLGYWNADAVVTYTPAMATQLGLERYDHKLYPNGARFVDTDQFDVTVPFERRERTVGFIGRLDIEKRIPELATAASALPPDIRFVFVGGGEYRETLEAEFGDCENVDVVGWVDREAVPGYLNKLQLLVVPSHPTEGLPTAVLEAMACGTPAYATPVSGVPDVVREGETGFLVDTLDGEQLASNIEEILELDDLPTISQSARELIETEYSFEAAVRRYRSILDGVTGA